jgi:hypothetical protein
MPDVDDEISVLQLHAFSRLLDGRYNDDRWWLGMVVRLRDVDVVVVVVASSQGIH